jgi:hypothetical protein
MRYKLFSSCLSLLLFSWQIAVGSPIHEKNQEIFAEMMRTHLEQQRDRTSFFRDIDLIGEEAQERGLDLSCYTYRTDAEGVCYTAFPLWEGKEQLEVVFLLFVWPSQGEAFKYCDSRERHATSIHSHPIPCAYTVLSGEITERRYQRLNECNRDIQFCGKQTFHLGEKGVDLNQDPFIHQLLFEGRGSAPAITLHVYGASSEEKLCRIFTQAQEEHEYSKSSIRECQEGSR